MNTPYQFDDRQLLFPGRTSGVHYQVNLGCFHAKIKNVRPNATGHPVGKKIKHRNKFSFCNAKEASPSDLQVDVAILVREGRTI